MIAVARRSAHDGKSAASDGAKQYLEIFATLCADDNTIMYNHVYTGIGRARDRENG